MGILESFMFIIYYLLISILIFNKIFNYLLFNNYKDFINITFIIDITLIFVKYYLILKSIQLISKFIMIIIMNLLNKSSDASSDTSSEMSDEFIDVFETNSISHSEQEFINTTSDSENN